MHCSKYLRTALAGTVSVFALATGAQAQSAQGANSTENVIVTGTRIENGSGMPTPMTVVSLDQLNVQDPTSIPEALAQLPMFAPTLGTTSHAEPNGRGFGTPTNNLNLHGLGPIRTLILMDGNRVPGTFYDTTVNVDMLPQMLVQRVDVVTGGASRGLRLRRRRRRGELYPRPQLHGLQGPDAGRHFNLWRCRHRPRRLRGGHRCVRQGPFRGQRGIFQSRLRSQRGVAPLWRSGA